MTGGIAPPGRDPWPYRVLTVRLHAAATVADGVLDAAVPPTPREAAELADAIAVTVQRLCVTCPY